MAAWGGTEPWLGFREFSNMLHSPPYSVLLNCDRWQVCPTCSSCRFTHMLTISDRDSRARSGLIPHSLQLAGSTLCGWLLQPAFHCRIAAPDWRAC